MTEMHDVVEMLLSRMKDYPEDFVSAPSSNRYNMLGEDSAWTKWNEALRTAKEVSNEQESVALETALKEAKRAVYMGAALKTILSDEEPEDEDKPYMTMKTQGRYATSIGQSMLATSQAMNNAIAMDKTLAVEGSSSLMSELEARVKAQEAQMQRQYALNDYKGMFENSGSALG